MLVKVGCQLLVKRMVFIALLTELAVALQSNFWDHQSASVFMKCSLSEHGHALDQENLTFKDNLLIVVLTHGSTEISKF